MLRTTLSMHFQVTKNTLVLPLDQAPVCSERCFTANYNFNIQIVEILQKVLANAEQVLRTEFHSPSSYTKLESAGQFQDPLHPHLYQCVQIDILVLLHTSIFSCRINNRSNYIQPD
jgi:hypothetical protein